MSELLKSFRENLESGLKKQAGVPVLNSVQRELIDNIVEDVSVQLAMKGLDKEASVKQTAPAEKPERTPPSFGQEFKQGVANSLGKALVGGLASAAIYGGYKAISRSKNTSLYQKYQAALAKAVATNMVLKQAKKEKVAAFGETIFNFAPHVASDPNLLSAILSNAIHGEALDPKTISDLVSLEAKHAEAGAFQPKSFF